MTPVLEQIIAHKRKEVSENKALFPIKLLEQSIYFASTPVSLKKYLLRDDLNGIIAEFKRKSPSKEFINRYADVERTTIGYMQAGSSALSVLTDSSFFGGKNEDLMTARKYNYCPIIRKDFIVDEYQVIEAKSIGADAILLIAAALSKNEIESLTAFAHSLGMEVLLEVHDAEELNKMCGHTNIVGVNNRNLKTMEVSIENSIHLADSIPSAMVKVAESGIRSANDIIKLRSHGYRGFLIGEFFMQHARPDQACMSFIKQLKTLPQPVLV